MMGTTGAPWTAEDLATVKKLWLAGETGAFIMQAIGGRKSRSAIIGVCQRRGWKRPRSISLANNRHVTKSRKVKVSVRPSMEKSLKKRLTRKTPPEPEPTPVVIDRAPISFSELSDKVCRYPVNDGPPWLFCGAPVASDSKYCCTHKKLCGGGYGS